MSDHDPPRAVTHIDLAHVSEGAQERAEIVKSATPLWVVVGLGQVLSLLITSTGVLNQLLQANYGVNTPATQNWFAYVGLLAIYGVPLMRSGNFVDILKERGGVYSILAILDIQAGFLIVKAYQTTSITSVMLLDCFTIPSTMVISYHFLRTRYRAVHFVACLLCVSGVAVLLLSDEFDGGEAGELALVGDALVIAAAALYATTNVAEERFIMEVPISEYLGMLGFFGTLFDFVQAFALEHKRLSEIVWSTEILGLYGLYTFVLLGFYGLVPIFLQRSTATVMNLSLLTADVWGLLVGIFFFHTKLSWVYFVAYTVIMGGLLLYHSRPTLYTAVHGQSTTVVGQEGETTEGDSDPEVVEAGTSHVTAAGAAAAATTPTPARSPSFGLSVSVVRSAAASDDSRVSPTTGLLSHFDRGGSSEDSAARSPRLLRATYSRVVDENVN